jgi:DNA-directed RNA polymerase specialized sigma24 family protein
LADRIPLLQRQGWHLLHAVHLALHWSFAGDDPGQSTGEELEQHPIIDPPEEQTDDEVGDAAPRDFVEGLVKEVMAKTARALAAEEVHPGVMQFVDGTFTVTAAMPRLRVPTNGYLFEIAMTLYLDECKRRGRKKRGGAGIPALEDVGATGNAERAPQHPVELMTLDSAIEFDMEERLDESLARPASDNSATAFAVPANDPTRQYEAEEFLEKFYEYLRKPVDEATEAYEKTQATRRALAERRKLESLTNKFARTISVLSMMGEGYTQERTAERLGLSRNQVKYIIALVQEAYARFAAASERSSTPILSMGEQSHVP